MSFFELIYGAVFQPKKTFASVGQEKPLAKCLLIFTLVLLLTELLWQGQLRSFGEVFLTDLEIPYNLSAESSYSMAIFQDIFLIMTVFFILFSITVLFVQTGLLNLVGELLGGTGNAKGLLCALALATIPSLIISVLDTLIIMVGLPGFISLVLALIGFLWIIILQILAVQGALNLSMGRSIATALLPVIALVIIILALVSSVLVVIFRAL